AVAAMHSRNGADFSSQTFDYIVVGGGTAGLALAARLSENPKVSVGVIEAGPYFENDPLIDTPALAGQLQGNSKYDWMFRSVPQSHVNDRSLPMPRGKALGGSSAINLHGEPQKCGFSEGLRGFCQQSALDQRFLAQNPHPRPNFIVPTEAQATKIEFGSSASDKNDKVTATGVSFVHNSTSYSVKARKEVILSAGAFQTPQLLELSGIGNSSILQQNGITTLVDLPGVGENLQDHLLIPSTYELKPGPTTLDILRNNASYAGDAQAQYAATHDGIYTASTSTLAFINLDNIVTPTELSNMIAKLDREIAVGRTTKLQKSQYSIQKDWLKKKVGSLEVVLTQAYGGAGTPKANTYYASIQMVIQHPFSRGSVHINSSGPLKPPEINPNYFTNSIDQEILVQALKFGLKIYQTEPLASFVITRQDPPPETSSDEEYTEYTKSNVRTIFHPIGTPTLAPRAIGGVVDTTLKVYGTSNVRVVDASIIPIHMGTHISRTVYGIGERAATIIADKASQID
ncbi:unnamed protein product, partial [Rhizoctonia solani]